MGKPMAPPPPNLMNIAQSQFELEMWQARVFLQGQLPSGVTITKVEKFKGENDNLVSWAVHVHLTRTDTPAVITAVSTRSDGILPIEAIIDKANLLGA